MVWQVQMGTGIDWLLMHYKCLEESWIILAANCAVRLHGYVAFLWLEHKVPRITWTLSTVDAKSAGPSFATTFQEIDRALPEAPLNRPSPESNMANQDGKETIALSTKLRHSTAATAVDSFKVDDKECAGNLHNSWLHNIAFLMRTWRGEYLWVQLHILLQCQSFCMSMDLCCKPHKIMKISRIIE